VFPAAEKEMVRAMLSESLIGVISQTLCKTKDGSGRVAAHEIMLGTAAIRNLIREAKIAQMYSAIQTGNAMGMQTLDQNLADLVRRNVVSPAEARAKAKFPENFPGLTGAIIMERDQASKFVNDLLRLMVSRNGSDLFLTADFRRDQGRRQGHQGLAAAADRPAHAGAGALGDERQAGGRVREDTRSATSRWRRRHRRFPRATRSSSRATSVS
jgi:hypothetical protein